MKLASALRPARVELLTQLSESELEGQSETDKLADPRLFAGERDRQLAALYTLKQSIGRDISSQCSIEVHAQVTGGLGGIAVLVDGWMLVRLGCVPFLSVHTLVSCSAHDHTHDSTSLSAVACCLAIHSSPPCLFRPTSQRVRPSTHWCVSSRWGEGAGRAGRRQGHE
mmetsp:Transcript_36210/g.103939  ORF Transcript_36210/g.103939 Transcript_36210/m.103939 type:complete len:168 (-) Transcript_36210:50-553(-)